MIEHRAEIMRRALRLKGQPVDDEAEAAIQQAAAEMLVRELAQWRGDHRYRLVDTGGQAVLGQRPHRLILQAAQRRADAGRELHRRLMDAANAGVGAPAQAKLAVAVIESNIYGDTPLSIRRAYEDFALTSFPLLEWAYDSPADERPRRSGIDTSKPLSENAVLDAINGRLKRPKSGQAERERQPGILDRLDPAFFDDLLAQTYLDVMDTGRFPNMGKVLSFDGTKAPVAKHQVQSVSRQHERIINDRMSDDECAFGYHGDGEGWRGNNGIFATDPGGPLMAVGARFIPARGAESPHLLPMLDEYIERVRRLTALPGSEALPLQYVTGDKAFNTKAICESLVFRYGIHPVFPWKADFKSDEIPWSDNLGIPRCSNPECEERGRAPDMNYMDVDGFVGPAQRASLGLEPGVDFRDVASEHGFRRSPRIRFCCPRCKATVRVKVEDAPHVYTFLPHKDVHHPAGRTSRHATRLQILGGRNVSESLNFALKFRCFALLGATTPRCVKTHRQMQVYGYGRLLAMSLKRLVNLNGDMAKASEEADAFGLTRPGLFRRLLQSIPDEAEADVA